MSTPTRNTDSISGALNIDPINGFIMPLGLHAASGPFVPVGAG